MGKETEREREAMAKQEEERAASDDPWFRCALCGHGLAPEKARMDVDGKHVHTFVNPAGHEYTIRCFAEAPGCIAVGDESTFWTWFPGFAWRVALCASCGTHVGWAFRAEERGFWGMVADRVR